MFKVFKDQNSKYGEIRYFTSDKDLEKQYSGYISVAEGSEEEMQKLADELQAKFEKLFYTLYEDTTAKSSDSRFFIDENWSLEKNYSGYQKIAENENKEVLEKRLAELEKSFTA